MLLVAYGSTGKPGKRLKPGIVIEIPCRWLKLLLIQLTAVLTGTIVDFVDNRGGRLVRF